MNPTNNRFYRGEGKPSPTDRLLANICAIHTEKEIEAMNTCPVCLLHVHNAVCAERDRLRKIAAHVPSKIYIKAYEAAGFGNSIKAQ